MALHPIVSDFIHTKVPGCEGPRHLRRPFHPRGPVAKTRVCLDRVFQCVPSRVLGFADDCWATEWCRCRVYRSDLDHTTGVDHYTSTWRSCLRRKCTARCPSWSTTRRTPHATSPRVSPRKARGHVPIPGPFPHDLRDFPPASSPIGGLGQPPFIAAPLLPRLWLSALPSLSPTPSVHVPPVSSSPPPSLYFLLC